MKQIISLNTHDLRSLDIVFNDFQNDNKLKNLSQNTISDYTNVYNYFIKLTGVEYVEQVNQTTYNTFINKLFSLSIRLTTVVSYNKNLSPFLSYLKTWYAVDIKKTKIVTDESIPKNYTDTELKILLEKPKNDNDFVDYRMWVICNFVMATGARSATIRNIKIEDIDFASGFVSYRHTKTHSALSVPISNTLQLIIKTYIRKYGLTDYLFPNIANHQLSENALKLSWRKYCVNRQIHKTSLHALRHSFTRIMAKNNVNPFLLQKMLGHSTITMSAHYCNLFNEDLKGMETPLDFILGDNRKHVIKKIK